MARLPALVDLIASFPGCERKAIDLKARVLRESGLLSRGKRGTGAPEVTSLDAAVLLLAHMATDGAASSPNAVCVYQGLTTRTVRGEVGPSSGEQAISVLARGAATPLQVLRDLIDEAARQGDGADGESFPPYLVALDRVARSVTIRVPGKANPEQGRLRPSVTASYECTWSGSHTAPSEDGEPYMSHTISLRDEAFRRIGRLLARKSMSAIAEPAPSDLDVEVEEQGFRNPKEIPRA